MNLGDNNIKLIVQVAQAEIGGAHVPRLSTIETEL
jgi:hypothetical protein